MKTGRSRKSRESLAAVGVGTACVGLADGFGTAKLDAVLEFRVSESELLTRLKSRGRADDTEEVILNRMKVYRDETAPLLDYYRDELVSVDAVGSLDEVFARALQALGS